MNIYWTSTHWTLFESVENIAVNEIGISPCSHGAYIPGEQIMNGLSKLYLGLDGDMCYEEIISVRMLGGGLQC